MHDLLLYVATVFMGFFAIMNPVANTPVFLGLTAGDDAETRKAVARNGLAIAFVIVATFTIAGKIIFDVFGITLPAFRITGGILVWGIGYNMLNGSASKTHHSSEPTEAPDRVAQLSVAVSPLAMPLLAGPGTIATAMNAAAERTFSHVAITITTFAVLCVISYFFFVSGERLIRYLGVSAVSAITRMMGLILAVIGVQMFLDGAHGAVQMFPQ